MRAESRNQKHLSIFFFPEEIIMYDHLLSYFRFFITAF